MIWLVMVDDDYNLFSKNGLIFLIVVRFINLKRLK